MQAGLIALSKALEQFDPSKGRIAGYLKLKLRHELQRLVYYGGQTVRVPRGSEDEAVSVALVGDEQTLDLLSGGAEGLGLLGDDVTPDDVARWEASGDWPDSLEEAQARVVAERERARPLLEAFLTDVVVLRRSARVARVPLFATFERFAGSRGAFPCRKSLRAELARREVRGCIVRVDWSPVPVAGFAGVQLQAAR